MVTAAQKKATAPKPGFANGVTSAGGGSSYDMVRSKILTGPKYGEPATGAGRVITRAREDMLQEIAARKGRAAAIKVGMNENLVARHRKPGAHKGDAAGDESAYLGTRRANTVESNKYREAVRDGIKKWKKSYR